MPLIKVTSFDAKLTKLVSANDINSLKEKGKQNVFFLISCISSNLNKPCLAEEKLGYKIEKFKRQQDQAEIEDNDVLIELINAEKEVWLVAFPKDYASQVNATKFQTVKVSTFNRNLPVQMEAKNMASLKATCIYLSHFTIIFVIQYYQYL